MSRPLARITTLALAALTAVGLGACGSSGSGGDAQKIVAQTFSGHQKVNSGNLDLTVGVNPQGASSSTGPITVHLSGPFQSQGTNQVPRFDFSLDLSVKGQTLSAGAVSTGDAGFLRFQGQAYTLPPQVFASFKQGVQQADTQRTQNPNQSTLSRFGVNPQTWLKNPKLAGSADVGGTATDHVTSQVDVPRFLADLSTILSKANGLGLNRTGQVPTSLTPQQIQTQSGAIKQAAFDLYSAKTDHSLRRLTLDVNYAPPSGTAAAYHVDLQFTNLNAPQAIGAPANPQPLANLTQAIKGLTGGGGLGGILGGGASGGGASGGGSTAPGTTGGAGSPSAGSPSAGSPTSGAAYLKCVQSAGQDTAKASQCLSLLGK